MRVRRCPGPRACGPAATAGTRGRRAERCRGTARRVWPRCSAGHSEAAGRGAAGIGAASPPNAAPCLSFPLHRAQEIPPRGQREIPEVPPQRTQLGAGRGSPREEPPPRAARRVPPDGRPPRRGTARGALRPHPGFTPSPERPYLELGGEPRGVLEAPEGADQSRQAVRDLRAGPAGAVAAERQELGERGGVAEALHHGVHEARVAVVPQPLRAGRPRPAPRRPAAPRRLPSPRAPEAALVVLGPRLPPGAPTPPPPRQARPGSQQPPRQPSQPPQAPQRPPPSPDPAPPPPGAAPRRAHGLGRPPPQPGPAAPRMAPGGRWVPPAGAGPVRDRRFCERGRLLPRPGWTRGRDGESGEEEKEEEEAEGEAEEGEERGAPVGPRAIGLSPSISPCGEGCTCVIPAAVGVGGREARRESEGSARGGRRGETLLRKNVSGDALAQLPGEGAASLCRRHLAHSHPSN